jgi:hypothetical protein
MLPDTQVEVSSLGSVVSSFECSVTNSRGMDQDIGSQFFVWLSGVGDIWPSQEERGLQTDHFGSRNNISKLERNIFNSQFRP